MWGVGCGVWGVGCGVCGVWCVVFCVGSIRVSGRGSPRGARDGAAVELLDRGRGSLGVVHDNARPRAPPALQPYLQHLRRARI